MTILHFNDVYNVEPREKEPVGERTTTINQRIKKDIKKDIKKELKNEINK